MTDPKSIQTTPSDNPKLSRRVVQRLRKLAAQRLEERRRPSRLLPPDPPPRYDEVWDEAMAQLAPSVSAKRVVIFGLLRRRHFK